MGQNYLSRTAAVTLQTLPKPWLQMLLTQNFLTLLIKEQQRDDVTTVVLLCVQMSNAISVLVHSRGSFQLNVVNDIVS